MPCQPRVPRYLPPALVPLTGPPAFGAMLAVVACMTGPVRSAVAQQPEGPALFRPLIDHDSLLLALPSSTLGAELLVLTRIARAGAGEGYSGQRVSDRFVRCGRRDSTG